MALSSIVSSIFTRLDADEVGLVQAADLLEKAFEVNGMLYQMQLDPRLVGFDTANRDGVGGNALEVHTLASDIAFVGWSWPETAHALCVEVEPGNKDVEIFNKRLVQRCELGPVEDNSIHFGSLSCGHTNFVLRIIKFSVASTCELLSESGKMSLDKLKKRDPEFADAVTRGLR